MEKQKLQRNVSARDSSINLVKEIVLQRWPDTIWDVPADIWSYWSFRYELAVESGILIPESMRDDIIH